MQVGNQGTETGERRVPKRHVHISSYHLGKQKLNSTGAGLQIDLVHRGQGDQGKKQTTPD